MEIVKATMDDISIIVDMKIKMSEELGISNIFQDNIEEKIREEYTYLYKKDKCFHYMVKENNRIVAIGGAVIKSDVPFYSLKHHIMVILLIISVIKRKGYKTS